jgi:hypothetical protein
VAAAELEQPVVRLDVEAVDCSGDAFGGRAHPAGARATSAKAVLFGQFGDGERSAGVTGHVWVVEQRADGATGAFDGVCARRKLLGLRDDRFGAGERVISRAR